MRRQSLDELDDLSPPPPNVIRFCGAMGCRRPARLGGRHCNTCHAAAVRRWREKNESELAAERREAATLRNADTRARDSARAKLAMAIRRGKVTRDRCRFCGSDSVIALMADPTKPLEVVWVCRADRQAEIDRRKADEARRVAAATQSDWQRERVEALAAIALLPLEVQAELKAIGARGPAGLKLSPEAPLYSMQLVRAYRVWLASKP
jgi:hypothetical protein